MQNFTTVDAVGILKAGIALGPVLFAPGYVIGWVLDPFEFRQRTPLLQLLLATPLSIAVCPMLSYLLARFFEPGLWLSYSSVTVVASVLLVKQARQARMRSVSRNVWIAACLLALWAITLSGSLVDLEIGDKLYPSVTAYDHSTRVEVTAAVARHMPPSNPFFAHPAIPLRYHYLWMLVCSLPLKILHFDPRHLIYAGIIWCCIGLICAIALGLKFFLAVPKGIEQTTLVAIVLLGITGLDILPTLYIRFSEHTWLPDMEWWNDAQITSWAGSLLWVPHHVAALIACFVAFLLLRHYSDARGKLGTVPMAVAAIALASASGLSVYVTFTFAVAIFLWLLALAARKEWNEIAMFTGAGALALVIASPYLSSLKGVGAGTAFVEFALRPFSFGLYLAHKFGIVLRTPSDVAFANLIFLPLNYFLELGFFLAIGLLRLQQLLKKRIPPTANELAAWTLVATGFLIGTFMRSSTINTNDLGWRCFLPAQLVLLLWGATAIHDWFDSVKQKPDLRPWARGVLASLLIIGALGTAYQLFMLRMFPVLFDRGVLTGSTWVESDRHFGKRTRAIRSAYEVLDAQLRPSAVIQINPATNDAVPHALYSGHDSVAGGLDCGTAFGGDPNLCSDRVRKLVPLFGSRSGDPERVCQEFGIDIIVANDTDPAWRDPYSWIWQRQPIVSNDYVRAFRCVTAVARSGPSPSSRGTDE